MCDQIWKLPVARLALTCFPSFTICFAFTTLVSQIFLCFLLNLTPGWKAVFCSSLWLKPALPLTTSSTIVGYGWVSEVCSVEPVITPHLYFTAARWKIKSLPPFPGGVNYSLKCTIPLSHCVIDVEGSILVASSDVISEQRVPSAVCIPRSDSGHRGVYGGAFTHTGVVRQVQEDWVIVIDVSDMDPHHHLKKMCENKIETSNLCLFSVTRLFVYSKLILNCHSMYLPFEMYCMFNWHDHGFGREV